MRAPSLGLVSRLSGQPGRAASAGYEPPSLSAKCCGSLTSLEKRRGGRAAGGSKSFVTRLASVVDAERLRLRAIGDDRLKIGQSCFAISRCTLYRPRRPHGSHRVSIVCFANVGLGDRVAGQLS